MEGREKGTITIVSVPVEKEKAGRVADSLVRIFKKAPQEKIQVEALLKKAPVVLVRNVSREVAEKIITSLGALEAEAVFQPNHIPRPIPVATPEQAVKARPKERKEPAPKPKREIPPTAEDTTSPAVPSRGYGRLLVATAGMAVFAAVAYTWLLGDNAMEQVQPTIVSAPSTGKPIPSIVSVPLSAQKLLAEFDMAHAPMYDRRMAEGLAEAIREYARLFPEATAPAKAQAPTKAEVTWVHRQTEPSAYRLTYKVKGAEAPFEVKVDLFTDHKRTAKNIPALAKALAQAVGKLGKSVRQPEFVGKFKGASARLVPEAMEWMDTPAVLLAMSAMGRKIGPTQTDPGALLGTANLLSWMAYVKSAQQTRTLPDMLAKQAVANHLVATLFVETSDPALTRSRALVWLGLGYPAAAYSLFPGAPDVEWKLIHTAVKSDAVGRDTAGDQKSKRLSAYLAARLARETGREEESVQKLVSILKDHPDFMLGVEYSTVHGSQAMARLAPMYLMEVSRRSLYLAEKLADLEWMGRTKELAAKVSTAKTGEAGMEEIVTLAIEVLGKSTRLQEEERILTYPFLARYLTEEIKEAAYLCFLAERRDSGNYDETSFFNRVIGRLWPGSSVAMLARIRNFRNRAEDRQALEAARTVDLESADIRLLEEVADLHIGAKEANIPRALQTIKALRAKSHPTPGAALRQARIYWRLGYRPISRELARGALEQDPYDARLYRHVAYLPEAEKLFRIGGLRFPGSAALLVHAGLWAEDNGDMIAAEKYYQGGTRLIGGQEAVARLADLYQKSSRPAKAENVLLDYLKTDDGSSVYLNARIRLAELSLAQGRGKEARKLAKRVNGAWGSESIAVYARGAEILGEKTEAAMHYRMGVERYPSGPAPARLAMFHLRQNNKKEAASLLRDYSVHNPPGYYFHGAVEHFIQVGDPSAVLDFVAEVGNGTTEKKLIPLLWWTLMDAKAYKAAAMAAHSHMSAPLEDRPYYFAGRYYQAAIKEDPDKAAAALEEAMRAMENNKEKWRYFGAWLITRGFYKEAFEVFQQYAQALPGHSGESSIWMGAAWRMGKLGQSEKAILKKRIAAASVRPWQASLARYYLGNVAEDKMLERMADAGKVPQALYALGASRLADGRSEEAEKFFAMAMERNDSRSLEFSMAAAEAIYVDERAGD